MDILQEIIINYWLLFLKKWKIYQFNWPWKAKSSFWSYLPFYFMHSHKSFIYIFILISEFFQHKEKAYSYFCKHSFGKLWETLNIRIRQRTGMKGFETFLEWFRFICQYICDDWLSYTHFSWCPLAFFRYCLLNPVTLMKICITLLIQSLWVDWINSSVIPINRLHHFISTLCGTYLLPKILTPLLFNFQENLLSSGTVKIFF